MNGDLVSLRLLLVAAAPPQQDLWREGATQASVPIDFEAHDAAAAKAALRGGGVDICVLNAELADADKASVIKTARAKKPAPLIFVSAPGGSTRPDNTDGVLPVPRQCRRCAQAGRDLHPRKNAHLGSDSGRIRFAARYRAEDSGGQPLRSGHP